MLIKENNNEDLTYEIFIEKSIKLLDKINIILNQYNTIENNTEILIKKIKKKLKIYTKRKDTSEKSEYKTVEDREYDKDIMKNLMNKLYKLNMSLNKYMKRLKINIYDVYLEIQKLYENSKYYDKDFNIHYKDKIKEIEDSFSIYEKIEINNEIDDLFEHINNISNNYILTTKIVLSINIIINLGELLKLQNTKLKIIYNDVNIINP